MKLAVKLREGISFVQDWNDGYALGGDGNFFEILRYNQENNIPIKLEDDSGNVLERTWSDVQSLEFIFD